MKWWSTWFRRAAPRLRVLDDFFPNLLTGFRVAEYNALLERFPGLEIASSYGEFERVHAEYAARYPRHAGRVVAFRPGFCAGAELAYLNFLNNAVQFLPELERERVPFVLTLYPGGGFGIDEPESDAKLARVLASPLLRGVIVTQSVTREYLKPRVRASLPLEEIFGVVSNPLYFEPARAPRPWHGAGKPSLDVAFVAEKYMARGENKGFPAFVEGVSRWRAALPPALADAVRVHVVGSFEPADWADAGGAPPDARTVFHGRLETAALRDFYQGIDVIVSPNRPFVLHSGNFDGFPTGCCVEASLCGVAVVAADVLGLDEGRYGDGAGFVRIEPTAAAVEGALARLAADPSEIARVARAGREVSRRLFAPEAQIGRRVAFLERMLGTLSARAA